MRRSDVTVEPSAVAGLHAHVLETIGASPSEWPGGWPDEIEAALIDAVYSVRARYGNRERKTGVFGAVIRWREHRGVPANDLSVLAGTPPDTLRAVVRNNGRIAGRSKAEIVHDAAIAFVGEGVLTADDFRRHQDLAQGAYLGVKGCGPVTWAYLRMLADVDDVKADTWLNRFVHDKIPEATPQQAAVLVKAVAGEMHVDERRLDHAIWAYQRSQAKMPKER